MRQSSTAAVKTLQRKGILIVDDHPVVRERLAEIINQQADLATCGEAEDRHQALEAIAAEFPDLVIADLKLKNSDGLELIKDIHSRWPKLPVLVLSMYDESLYAERSIRAGARGYINKQEATRNILPAIRRVLDGGLYLDERISNRIVSRLTASPKDANTGPEELLAERELQVFELTGDGLSPHQIAAQLNIGVKTVETYRTRIREKLGLKNGSELLQLAIAWTHDSALRVAALRQHFASISSAGGEGAQPARQNPPGDYGDSCGSVGGI